MEIANDNVDINGGWSLYITKREWKTAFHESYLYRGLCSHLNIIVIEIRFFFLCTSWPGYRVPNKFSEMGKLMLDVKFCLGASHFELHFLYIVRISSLCLDVIPFNGFAIN